MNNLYNSVNKLFPETVNINGKEYEINADYRNILRIFAIIGDYDIDENIRIERLLEWFYNNSIPNETVTDLMTAFNTFVNPPKEYEPEEYEDGENETGEHNERQFDYDFDADEIFASFISEYNIDLTEVQFLHWYKFKVLLHNLSSESAFKNKIELRFMDLSHYTGQSLVALQKAKAAVQLPEEMTEEEYNNALLFEATFGKL